MITLPTINLNGTSPASLLDDYLAAKSAITKAIDAMRAIHPHGRDYQLDPPRLRVAQVEHYARVAALAALASDVELLADHAAQAVADRSRR